MVVRRKPTVPPETKGQATSQHGPHFHAELPSPRRTEEHTGRMAFTGEAPTNYLTGVGRYMWARQMIPDIDEKRVLDVPCGIGYGSNNLAKKAMEVVGVDISEEAIAEGTAKYLSDERRRPRENLSLLRMDAQKMSLSDNSVDASVSFEGLEHVPDPRKMVAEMRRVLKPGGVLIISTPNKELSRQVEGKPENPFHLKEFTREEFEALLKEQFESVELYGQQIMKPGGRWIRGLVGLVKAVDVLELRRFIPKRVKRVVREDLYGEEGIRKVDEPRGEKPQVWVAVCK